jgi:hypothetical protein
MFLAGLAARGPRRPAYRDITGFVMIPWLLMAILLGSGCEVVKPSTEAASGSDGAQEVVLGEDYSLPAWAAPAEFSGYVDQPDGGSVDGGLPQRNLTLTWADLEPEPGVYDFSRLEQGLAYGADNGLARCLHILSIVWGGGDPTRGITVPRSVPDWAMAAFDLDEGDLANLGWEFDIEVIPGWRPEIRDAFNRLIRTLGERYASSPQLGSVYVGGISPSRGEEFWLYAEQLSDLEQNHGLTPELLEEWLSSRLEAFADAFQGEMKKVVWVGKLGAWRYCGDQRYTDLAWRLVQRAWELGAGNRSSAVEYYLQWLNEPALGSSVDGDGHLLVDETIPPIATLRYFGDENEEYGESWSWRYGDPAGDRVRYRFSVMRALQMRLRFLWTSAPAEELNPPLSEYVRLGLGQSVETSPDAWAFLFESPVNTSNSPVGAVRNFERWLIQRDLPGGMTVPTARIDRQFNAGSTQDPAQFYDFTARRTDVAGGSPSIWFDLDDRFHVTGGCQIKVEIIDDSEARWRIEYDAGTATPAWTGTTRGRGDGKVRTVTFAIPDARFGNALEHGMDFRIRCEGSQDVTVRWVRVIRDSLP